MWFSHPGGLIRLCALRFWSRSWCWPHTQCPEELASLLGPSIRLGREACLDHVSQETTKPGPWAKVLGTQKVFNQNLEQRLRLSVLEVSRSLGASMMEMKEPMKSGHSPSPTPHVSFL
jgi:hypothetical protein